MLTVAAWFSHDSGLGHYTRAKRFVRFFKHKKKKVIFFTFKNLEELSDKIQKKTGNTLIIDTYIFSKKIEKKLKKNFKKVIIINDYQFKVPKDFFLLDTFKYTKKINHKLTFFGVEYIPNEYRKQILKKKTKQKYDFLIILNNRSQNKFYKLYNSIDKKSKKIVVNIKDKEINNLCLKKKDIIAKPFIAENKLLNYAKKSKFIISPGGQTMMFLIENNQFINVYKTSENQSFYINMLYKKKLINKISLNSIFLEKNKKINYLEKRKKNMLLDILK